VAKRSSVKTNTNTHPMKGEWGKSPGKSLYLSGIIAKGRAEMKRVLK